MADLDRRLRSLDSIPAPDLWARVGTSSEERPVSPFPSRWRRAAIGTVALSLSVLAFVFAFDGWRNHRGRFEPADQVVTAAGLVRQGTLLCTVTAPAGVDPGDPLGLVFAIENVGDEPREFPAREATSYVIVDGDGADYDSKAAWLAQGSGVRTSHRQRSLPARPGRRTRRGRWSGGMARSPSPRPASGPRCPRSPSTSASPARRRPSTRRSRMARERPAGCSTPAFRSRRVNPPSAPSVHPPRTMLRTWPPPARPRSPRTTGSRWYGW